MGWGWALRGPKGKDGQENFPCHAGRGRRHHLLDPPHSIAIPMHTHPKPRLGRKSCF